MKNDKCKPLKLRYAGNLATDDFLWIVEGSTHHLIDLIKRPRAWVRGLGSIPHWPKTQHCRPFPKPKLKKHFTMRFGQFKQEPTKENPAPILIQGISGTGMITAFATERATAKMALSLLSEMRLIGVDKRALSTLMSTEIMKELERGIYSNKAHSTFLNLLRDCEEFSMGDAPMNVNVDVDNARFFAHRCIYHPSQNLGAAIRAHIVGLYLCGNACRTDAYVESLSCLECATRKIHSNGHIDYSTGHFVVHRPSSQGLFTEPGIQFIYSGTDGSNEEICDVVDGTTPQASPPDGTVHTSTVKSYSPIPGMDGLRSDDYEVLIRGRIAMLNNLEADGVHSDQATCEV
jgi:hypothetical protein